MCSFDSQCSVSMHALTPAACNTTASRRSQQLSLGRSRRRRHAVCNLCKHCVAAGDTCRLLLLLSLLLGRHGSCCWRSKRCRRCWRRGRLLLLRGCWQHPAGTIPHVRQSVRGHRHRAVPRRLLCGSSRCSCSLRVVCGGSVVSCMLHSHCCLHPNVRSTPTSKARQLNALRPLIA